MASIAAVLECYDDAVIRQVTDPRTGISTTEKFQAFMPNSGELKLYCDAVSARARRIDEFAKLPKQPPKPKALPSPTEPGTFANVRVHAEHPRYQQLVERTKTADQRYWKFDARGLHVSLDWLT